MKYLVAVCCVSRDFLSSPAEFLANPSSRTQPTWAYGVVSASSKRKAYDLGEEAGRKGS